MTAGSILVPQVIPLQISIPGKAKHEIDTNTLVAIKSDTPDVTIYYTIDGSKPQLFRKFGYRDHNTFKYMGPITLPDGKITIKALAVTKDCRESAIVTKVFLVGYVTPNTHVPHEDNDENFLEGLSRQEMENGLSKLRLRKNEVNMESNFNRNAVAQEFQGLSKEKRFVHSHLSGTHLLNTSSDREEFKSATSMPLPQTWHQAMISLPTSTPNLLEKKEQGTQTTGLFYPSNKHLEKQDCQLVSLKKQQNKINNHKLTAVSPGKGYWRKQLDHICAHLRSYTQNNLEFRTLVGELQMGKLTSATVHKDGYQVSLQINYALAINKDILTSKPATFGYCGLSPNEASRAGLYEGRASLASEENQRISSPNEKVKRMMKTRKCLEKEDKLTTESRQLLQEVGPKGQGQPFLVEQLIDEGADPNCTNNADQPVLTLAVLNKHHQAIPILVQKGADIDHQSGLLNNTALHEAVSLGLEGWECIEALLGCDANIKKKNTRGLSVCDLALKSANDKIISLFAGKPGWRTLDKLTPPKLSPANY